MVLGADRNVAVGHFELIRSFKRKGLITNGVGDACDFEARIRSGDHSDGLTPSGYIGRFGCKFAIVGIHNRDVVHDGRVLEHQTGDLVIGVGIDDIASAGIHVHFHEVETFLRSLPPIQLIGVAVERHGLGELGLNRQFVDEGAVPCRGVDKIQFSIAEAVGVGDTIHLAISVNSQSNPVVTTHLGVVHWSDGTIREIDGVDHTITQTVHGPCGHIPRHLSESRQTLAEDGERPWIGGINLTELAIRRKGVDVVGSRVVGNYLGSTDFVALVSGQRIISERAVVDVKADECAIRSGRNDEPISKIRLQLTSVHLAERSTEILRKRGRAVELLKPFIIR